uniref:BTB domain-containing protein n=1 Tax=Strongyloides papillosus TaxID=174720 RepID=A0A0N5BA71_STREA
MSYYRKEVLMNTFSKSSPTRQFRLFAGGETFYVNGYYLAELSPYFETLFFNEFFTEARTKTVSFTSVDWQELHVFLEYLCPVSRMRDKREITVDNFHILIYFSNRFLIREIEYPLIQFVKDNFDACRVKFSCSKLLVMSSYLISSNSPKEFLQFCYESIALYPEKDVMACSNIISGRDMKCILEECTRIRRRIMECQLDKTQDDYDIRDEHLRGIINCTDNITNYFFGAFIAILIYFVWLM